MSTATQMVRSKEGVKNASGVRPRNPNPPTYSGSRPKFGMVDLRNIVNDIFVRESIDHDYVLSLALIYEKQREDEAPVEEIWVSEITPGQFRLIEGRHRHAAASLADRNFHAAWIYPNMPKKDALALAIAANMGGKRAPTKHDILTGLESLVKSGASDKYIREQIPLPKQVLDVYLGEVRGSIQRQKLAQARELLADGRTVEEAANALGLTVERIQTELLGKRKNHHQQINVVKELLARIKARNMSVGKWYGFIFKDTMKNFNGGDLSQEEVLKVVSEVERHGRLCIDAASDMRQRFFAKIA